MNLMYILLLSLFLLTSCVSEEVQPVEQESHEATKEDEKSKDASESESTKPAPQENTVYGSLNEEGMTKLHDMMYRENDREVDYIIADGEVFQVEVHLDPALGLNVEMDQSFFMEHAFDYMEDDATLIQTKSDNEFVYESSSLGKKYDVVFAGDTGDGVITRVMVTQHVD